MKTHIEWQVEEATKLIGMVIAGVAQDDENEMFGLILEKGKKQVVAWILVDPEGNGPGTLYVQQLRGEK